MTYIDRFLIKHTSNYKCNYDCKYCTIHGEDKVTPTLDNFKKYLNIINDILVKDYHGVTFSLTGGEPSVSPIYVDTIKYMLGDIFKDRDFILKLDTNLTHPEKIVEIIDYHKSINSNAQLYLRVSYHGEELNYDFESLLEKIIKISDIRPNKMKILFHFMLENSPKIKDNIDWVFAHKDYILGNNIYIKFKGISDFPDYYNECDTRQYLFDNYELRDFDKLLVRGYSSTDMERIYTRHQRFFKYQKCNAVINAVHFYHDGTIFPCPNTHPNVKPLGNLNDETTLETMRKIKEIGWYWCQYDSCKGSTEFNYPEKIGKNTPLKIIKI